MEQIAEKIFELKEKMTDEVYKELLDSIHKEKKESNNLYVLKIMKIELKNKLVCVNAELCDDCDYDEGIFRFGDIIPKPCFEERIVEMGFAQVERIGEEINETGSSYLNQNEYIISFEKYTN